MVDDHLEPERAGTVRHFGELTQNHLLYKLAADIERHGEVHATFKEVDEEVECRLGTTRIDARNNIISVFDGDQYNHFNGEHLITWDVPMELYHE